MKAHKSKQENVSAAAGKESVSHKKNEAASVGERSVRPAHEVNDPQVFSHDSSIPEYDTKTTKTVLNPEHGYRPDEPTVMSEVVEEVSDFIDDTKKMIEDPTKIVSDVMGTASKASDHRLPTKDRVFLLFVAFPAMIGALGCVLGAAFYLVSGIFTLNPLQIAYAFGLMWVSFGIGRVTMNAVDEKLGE